jgi:hypothetical protein
MRSTPRHLMSMLIAAAGLLALPVSAQALSFSNLRWEDGRRVVFQTAVVMFEISRALY